MPNQPDDELIPECVDAQLPSGTRLRFCLDEPLMTSDAGLLLLAEHAAQSGDIATALAPKLKAPAPGERKPRAPEHSKQELLTQRVMQMIARPHGVDQRYVVTDFEDAGARLLYEDIYCGRGRGEL